MAVCGSQTMKQPSRRRREGQRLAPDYRRPTILLTSFQSLLCSWIVSSSVWYQQYSGAVLPPSVMVLYFMYLLSSSLSFSFSPLNFCFSPRRIISSPSSFLTHKNFSIFNMKKFSPKYYLKSTSIRSSLGNVNKHELHHICGPSYNYLLWNFVYNDE